MSADEALEVLDQRARAAEAEADKAGTAATALGCDYAAARFLRWTAACGIDLDAMAEVDGQGWRHLPPAVAAAYAVQIARPGAVGSDWFLDTLSQLRTALTRSKVVIAGFTDRSVPEVAETLTGLAAQLEDADRRPAVPVLASHLCEIDDAVAGLDAHPVWVATLRAWQTLSWTFAGRAVETTTRLRWKDFSPEGDRDRLTWPAGCKYQDVDITLTRTRTNELPAATDVRQRLEALRIALCDAGHEPHPDDHIFPVVDIATGQVTLNPVDALLDDPEFRSELDELARRGRAERSVTQRYRQAWTKVAATTSIAQNLGHRRLAPHGLRRALATLLAALGASDLTIQHEMRHGKLSTTLLYVDGRSVPVSDAYALLDDLDAGRPVTDPHGLLGRALALIGDADCDVVDGADGADSVLPVLSWDQGCGVEACWVRRPGELWSEMVDGTWMVLCTGHLGRFSRGDADWAEPLERCAESRPWFPCRVGPLISVVDGDSTLRLCPNCHGRYRKALARGDTTNWQERRAQRIIGGTKCEADCDAAHGPGMKFMRVTVAGRTWILCNAHAARARNGAKPGWTQPIRRRRTGS